MPLCAEDRIDYRLAIVRSGLFQYRVAAQLGVTEFRLSAFLNGRGTLRPDELTRLREILGMAGETANVST